MKFNEREFSPLRESELELLNAELSLAPSSWNISSVAYKGRELLLPFALFESDDTSSRAA